MDKKPLIFIRNFNSTNKKVKNNFHLNQGKRLFLQTKQMRIYECQRMTIYDFQRVNIIIKQLEEMM